MVDKQQRPLKPRWAARVAMAKPRRLYEGVAAGRVDDELVDEVGFSLIEGNRKVVIAFLDTLSYGRSTPPEVLVARDAWRTQKEEVEARATTVHRTRRSSESVAGEPV